jgi:hypothetical protein
VKQILLSVVSNKDAAKELKWPQQLLGQGVADMEAILNA